MKKHIFIFLCSILTSNVYADPLSDIFDILSKDMYPTEKSIDRDVKDVSGSLKEYMTGHYNMGNLKFDKDLQSWGRDTIDWKKLLMTAKQGGSSSDYGQIVEERSDEYPTDEELISQTDPNESDQNFYQLKAQTALAARSASELDYNNIEKQISYQQNLQQQIDGTPNEKAAIDLQNRLQVENNLINLELLRQMALLSQQKSMDIQQDVNSAVRNAQFLRDDLGDLSAK